MKGFWSRRFGVVVAVGSIILTVWLICMADGASAKDKPIEGPRVVDANNKVVGPVIGSVAAYNVGFAAGLDPVVALAIPIPNMAVKVSPNQFVGIAVLFFTTADCSGQPYFDYNLLRSLPVLPPAGVWNGILYGPRANSAPVTIDMFSGLDHLGNCNFQGNPANGVVIADPIFDLSAAFTPPYRFVYP